MTDVPKPPFRIAQLSPEQEHAKAATDAFFKDIRDHIQQGHPKMTKTENLGSIRGDLPHPSGLDKIAEQHSARDSQTIYYSTPDVSLSLLRREVPLPADSGKLFLGILAQPDKHKFDPDKLNADLQALRGGKDPTSYGKDELSALQNIMQNTANPRLYKFDSVKVQSINGMNVLEASGTTVDDPPRSFHNLYYADSDPYMNGIKVGEISFKAPTKLFMDNLTDVLHSLDTIQWERHTQ